MRKGEGALTLPLPTQITSFITGSDREGAGMVGEVRSMSGGTKENRARLRNGSRKGQRARGFEGEEGEEREGKENGGKEGEE